MNWEKGGRVEARFKINGEFIELNKLLKAEGLCDTGGMAKAVIREGRVEVDGSVEWRVRCKIRPGQRVSFQDHIIHVE
jgi:ribosome-associated protein